jgi:hypothetical protein
MMRRALATIALVTLTGCTPAEVQAWVAWHDQDPDAAVAFAENLPPEPAPVLRNGHAAQWERIAWCESGRNWSMRATNRTGTYGGGLAIRDNVWRHYGGGAFAPNAGAATKAEQIEIAERILADVGWGAWDCA